MINDIKMFFNGNKEYLLNELKEEAKRGLKTTIKKEENLENFSFENFLSHSMDFFSKVFERFVDNLKFKTLCFLLDEQPVIKMYILQKRFKKRPELLEFKEEIKIEIESTVLLLKTEVPKLLLNEKNRRLRIQDKSVFVYEHLEKNYNQYKKTLEKSFKILLAKQFLTEPINKKKGFFHFYDFKVVSEFYTEAKVLFDKHVTLEEFVKKQLSYGFVSQSMSDLHHLKGFEFFDDFLSDGKSLMEVILEHDFTSKIVEDILSKYNDTNFQDFMFDAFKLNQELSDLWQKVRLQRITK